MLSQRTVEGNRFEFKATWNDVTAHAAIRTACAFANDLLNLNGGYIVIGVEEPAEAAELLSLALQQDTEVVTDKQSYRTLLADIQQELGVAW